MTGGQLPTTHKTERKRRKKSQHSFPESRRQSKFNIDDKTMQRSAESPVFLSLVFLHFSHDPILLFTFVLVFGVRYDCPLLLPQSFPFVRFFLFHHLLFPLFIRLFELPFFFSFLHVHSFSYSFYSLPLIFLCPCRHRQTNIHTEETHTGKALR